MEARLPGIGTLWDKHNHIHRLCSDRSVCSDTCDCHPGTRQCLKKDQDDELSLE